ncbi:hypothetical protein U5801_26660 [Lamprobacter modestohalophilus]|uniref:hypothetical protein n=1 Tax=Lamprobacter modestohalophilus TaxID=1064514 RepID=UPI002ADEEC74|nr:hypothetical protein [Lamprobacter modestohalophilus]MEA1053358.1 hypothetical protein [Lamprobacter modestohalophilus]
MTNPVFTPNDPPSVGDRLLAQAIAYRDTEREILQTRQQMAAIKAEIRRVARRRGAAG